MAGLWQTGCGLGLAKPNIEVHARSTRESGCEILTGKMQLQKANKEILRLIEKCEAKQGQS